LFKILIAIYNIGEQEEVESCIRILCCRRRMYFEQIYTCVYTP